MENTVQIYERQFSEAKIYEAVTHALIMSHHYSDDFKPDGHHSRGACTVYFRYAELLRENYLRCEHYYPLEQFGPYLFPLKAVQEFCRILGVDEQYIIAYVYDKK